MNLLRIDKRELERSAEMDRQSRVLWLRTFSTCLERSTVPKAADEAGRAVERFRMAFTTPTLEVPDARAVEERRADLPHRLDAGSCLLRVKVFIRDEIARRKKTDEWSPQAITGMESLADDVGELVKDILRPDLNQGPLPPAQTRWCEACQSTHDRPKNPECFKPRKQGGT